jgi:hypothetical protein
MLLFRLFGLFLLRLAERALSWLLFHVRRAAHGVKSTGGPAGCAAAEPGGGIHAAFAFLIDDGLAKSAFGECLSLGDRRRGRNNQNAQR